MIRFRTWTTHNSRVIKDIIGKRVGRKARVDAPLYLGKIMLDTKLDGNFERFAAAVGGDRAETFMVRALQYAAENDGLHGCIRVPEKRFGHLVLSRKWHCCSAATGSTVYQALLSSGICVPILEGDFEAKSHVRGDTVGADTSTPTGADSSRLLVPVLVPVHPPNPPAGGSVEPSASQRPRNNRDRPLRPRVRELFARTITAAVQHGSASQREEAEQVRLRYEAGELDDEDIEEILAGAFSWVPRDLAKEAPAAQPTPTPHAQICDRHRRLKPCETCKIAETQEKLRAGQIVVKPSAFREQALRQGCNLTGRGKPTEQPATTPKPEPPPDDAERRKLIREMFGNAASSPGNGPSGDDRPSA